MLIIDPPGNPGRETVSRSTVRLPVMAGAAAGLAFFHPSGIFPQR
jgi:hypothetical protein